MSTDYVFGGGAARSLHEDAAPAPVNVYGESKLEGERLVRAAGPDHVVVRSSGLYGVAGSSGKGGNFVETMLRLAREGRDIAVVDDQVLAPTYTADLAEAITRLLAANPPGGIYHLTNAGACSWFDFARRIFRLCRPRAEPRADDQRRLRRRRPDGRPTRFSRTHARPRSACRRSARGPRRSKPTSAPRGTAPPDPTPRPAGAPGSPLLQ